MANSKFWIRDKHKKMNEETVRQSLEQIFSTESPHEPKADPHNSKVRPKKEEKLIIKANKKQIQSTKRNKLILESILVKYEVMIV